MAANAVALLENPVETARPRLSELDGVRGLAILMVLVWHYIACEAQTTPGSMAAYGVKLLSMTWVGVDLSFVLSGFLIGGILLDNRAASNYFTVFYTRRLLRICPLYWLLLVPFVGAVLFAGGRAHPEWFEWLFANPLPLWSYATYLQNLPMATHGTMGPNWLSVTWPLAVEEQFYLLLPPMIRFAPQAAPGAILCLLIVEAPVMRTLSYSLYPTAGLPGFLWLPGRWDSLFMGVLAAHVLRVPENAARLNRSLPAIRVAAVASGVVLLGLLATNQGIASMGMTVGGHTVVALLGVSVILLATLSHGGATQRLFRHPYLVWLGNVSYGIYLFHQPIAGLLHGALRAQAPRIAGVQDALVTLLAFCLTLGLAAASWQFFERHLVSVGHRVRYVRAPSWT